MLAGIVMLVIGIFGGSPTALGVGVVLAGLGGLEVAVREHFAGYRSHTTLLAGTVFVLVVGGLFYLAGLILAICLAVGAVAFLAAFFALRRAFQRASGGSLSRSAASAAADVGRQTRTDFAGTPARREQGPLAGGQGAEPLVLVEREAEQELAGAGAAPAALAGQQLGQGHALGLPGALADDVGGLDVASGDRALQLRPRKSHAVGAGKGLHVLRGLGLRKRSSEQGRSKQRPLGLLPFGSLTDWFLRAGPAASKPRPGRVECSTIRFPAPGCGRRGGKLCGGGGERQPELAMEPPRPGR